MLGRAMASKGIAGIAGSRVHRSELAQVVAIEGGGEPGRDGDDMGGLAQDRGDALDMGQTQGDPPLDALLSQGLLKQAVTAALWGEQHVGVFEILFERDAALDRRMGGTDDADELIDEELLLVRATPTSWLPINRSMRPVSRACRGLKVAVERTSICTWGACSYRISIKGGRMIISL